MTAWSTMMSWGGPPWRSRLGRPAAMTVVQSSGQQILFEPLGKDEAQRALLRGALRRRLEARRKRNMRGGK